MRKLIFLFALIYATHVEAGGISGQVTVLKRSGLKPMRNFTGGVVYIKNLQSPAPVEPAVMEQKYKKFIPRLLPVVSGQKVRFINSEFIRHNVFSPHPREPFDLGHYPRGEHKSFWFKELGAHKIYCNIHQKMVADVFVVPSIYYDLTDAKGNYKIESVPSGTHTIGVWHILGGEDEKTVRVEDRDIRLDFTINSHKVIKDMVRHPNKFGKSYRREYSDDEGKY
ncbi:MAG: hypothetical protein JJV98_00570 [Desulfosarcina sp.]|nr:hypothetical protein [Desulfobacterales bacterium]